MRSVTADPLGLALGVLADAVFADPRRAHPVAGFGRWAQALERRLYRDGRWPGVAFTALAVGAAGGLGLLAHGATERRPLARSLVTAGATWAVLGGTSLAREGAVMADLLEARLLAGPDGARARLSHLCARDAAGLQAPDLARASVESLAENVSDAVVAPLAWGVAAGLPGLLGYRAVNTLDAMVGYRSSRYRRFGWAAARLDDVANVVPARLSGVLLVACAPVVGGSPRRALAVLRRDGAAHPSPNAGRPEAAVAGALGVVLGGSNTYQGRRELRPELGAPGRAVSAQDLRRTVGLVRVTGWVAAAFAVAISAVRSRTAARPAGAGRTR